MTDTFGKINPTDPLRGLTHMLWYVRAHLGAEPSAADAQSYRGLFKCFVRGAFLGE
jgi:hypothetical protein